MLDYLSKVVFSSNIGIGFLSAILIGDNLKDLPLKFAYIFGFSARVKGFNNIAVNYKRICSKIPAIISGFFFLNKY